jgi:rhodanese-related sulfurtransferase
MRKYLNLFIVMAIIPLMVMTSCKKTDDDDDGGSTTKKGTYADLKNYMLGAGLDLTDVLITGWVVPASNVVDSNDYTIPGWYVIDIRSASDFADGHIKGAHNVELKDVVSHAKANAVGEKVLIVCKTGQTAGHAVMALRLSGFADAAVLKFGMAGWNEHFAAPWEDNHGNLADENASEWKTDASPGYETFSTPSWESTATEGAAILEERVTLMLNNGFKAISSDAVFGHQSDFQIHNFWAADDYTTFGHFSDAYQLKPISLGGDEVSHIDSEGSTLIYCFTGQTSSMVTAWLNVLGYDATSILFGVNRLKYDELEAAGKPHWHGPATFDYEEGK